MIYVATQEHEELRAKVRAFAEAEVKPIAFKLDRENCFPRDAVTKMGELGLTEPNAGSDAGGTETTAEDMGDYYLLNGEKRHLRPDPGIPGRDEAHECSGGGRYNGFLPGKAEYSGYGCAG